MTPNPSVWVEKYGDYLFSVALLRVGSRETAEDLVQETFLSAIRGLDGFRHDSTEKTWLTSILRNKIVDHYRKKDVLKDVSAYISDTAESFSTNFFEDSPDRYGHWREGRAPRAWEPLVNPADDDAEFEAVLSKCLNGLPVRLLSVFTAKYMDEQKAEKTCKEFNLTPSNYWVILHRAKVIIRECLERNWFDEK